MISDQKWLDFKNKQLAKIMKIRSILLEKHKNNTITINRIEYLVTLLLNKLQYLNEYNLLDYIRLIHLITKEYPEFNELMPTYEEIDNLLVV